MGNKMKILREDNSQKDVLLNYIVVNYVYLNSYSYYLSKSSSNVTFEVVYVSKFIILAQNSTSK